MNRVEHDTSLPAVLVAVKVAIDEELARRKIDFVGSKEVEKTRRWAWERAMRDRMLAVAARAIVSGSLSVFSRVNGEERRLPLNELGSARGWLEGVRVASGVRYVEDPVGRMIRKPAPVKVNLEWLDWLVPAAIDWNALESGSGTKREPTVDSVPNAQKRGSYLKMLAALGDQAGLFSKEKRLQTAAALTWLDLLDLELNETSVRVILDEIRAAGFIKEPAGSAR